MTLDEAIEAAANERHLAWMELTGYVDAAVDDGEPIDATRLRGYMRELQERWRKPMREWASALGEEEPPNHEFLPVAGHPDDDECTHRADGTDATYCGRTASDHNSGSTGSQSQDDGRAS